jgi:hypothetical protein
LLFWACILLLLVCAAKNGVEFTVIRHREIGHNLSELFSVSLEQMSRSCFCASALIAVFLTWFRGLIVFQ